MTADIIHLRTPEERVKWLLAQVPKPKQVEIRTVHQALAWGDDWHSVAKQLQAQVDKLQMLLLCAQINEKASALLLEFAEAELERLRGINGES